MGLFLFVCFVFSWLTCMSTKGKDGRKVDERPSITVVRDMLKAKTVYCCPEGKLSAQWCLMLSIGETLCSMAETPGM